MNSSKAKETFEIFGPFSIRLVLGLILAIASFFLFIKMSEDLIYNELQIFDQLITNFVRHYTSVKITNFMIFLSSLGSPYFLTIIGLFTTWYFTFYKKHFWDGMQVFVVLAGSTIMNNVLKVMFHRSRPSIKHLAAASGFSFPSGHAMVSYAFYGLIIYLFWINVKSTFTKILLAILFTILILLIGISRIYLGVHYPSDVVAGYAAGSVWLMACILSLRGIRYYKSSRQ